jgi:hypothetical protein
MDWHRQPVNMARCSACALHTHAVPAFWLLRCLSISLTAALGHTRLVQLLTVLCVCGALQLRERICADPELQAKATAYLTAMLDLERPAQLSWYSEWAVHASKPSGHCATSQADTMSCGWIVAQNGSRYHTASTHPSGAIIPSLSGWWQDT